MSAISELSTIHRVKAKTPEEKRLAAKEAGRDNKAGYLFLLPWLIGLVANHRRADGRLAVPVVYQLQPDPAPELGRSGQLRRMLSDPRLHKSIGSRSPTCSSAFRCN
jgi:multiple sugar transport system permease protein